jgi:putative membrane protein insertion efficiency factor
MAVDLRGHRSNLMSSRGERIPVTALLSISGFLVLLLLVGAPETVLAVSGAGMKGPPARGSAAASVNSDTADNSSAQQLLLGGIRFFQRWISPIDGPRCNFTPTCSKYGFQAVQSQGVLLGMVLTADRLMRCHYFVESGYIRLSDGRLYDPVINNLPPRP